MLNQKQAELKLTWMTSMIIKFYDHIPEAFAMGRRIDTAPIEKIAEPLVYVRELKFCL